MFFRIIPLPSTGGGEIFDDFWDEGNKKLDIKRQLYSSFFTFNQIFIDFPPKILYFPQFSEKITPL